MKAKIQVCLGCDYEDADRRKPKHRGGVDVAEMLNSLLTETDLGGAFELEPYGCLGRCSGGGRISFGSLEKWSWLFESIDPAEDKSAVETILRQWLASKDGRIPSKQRPPTLRAKELGRLAPMHPDAPRPSMAEELSAEPLGTNHV